MATIRIPLTIDSIKSLAQQIPASYPYSAIIYIMYIYNYNIYCIMNTKL